MQPQLLQAAGPPRRTFPQSLQELLAAEPEALEPGRRLLLRGRLLRGKVLGRRLAFGTLALEAHAEVQGPWRPGPPPAERLPVAPAEEADGDGGGDGAAAPVASAATVGLCFTAGLVDEEGAMAAHEEGMWSPSASSSGPSAAAAGTADADLWAAFPGRRAELPVGMRLEASVLFAPAVRSEELLVRRWRALPGPAPPAEGVHAAAPTPSSSSAQRDLVAHHAARNAANERARRELLAARRGPALCKVWAAGRGGCCDDGCRFRHEFAGPEEQARALAAAEAQARSREAAAREQATYEEVQDSPHDTSKAAKSRRASRFAAWLLRQYGRERLCQGAGVLDVAGGQGDLSWALSVDEGVPCTLVDPGIRRRGELRSWQRRALRKSGSQGFAHVPEEFCARLFGPGSSGDAGGSPEDGGLEAPPRPPYAPLLLGASLVVGLHPDEATEAIVDLALASGRKFAVVPCCVFASKFPDRRLQETGELVRTVNQFCTYLREKHEGIRETLLDFEGRNKVLYMP